MYRNYSRVEKYLSTERLNRYLRACNHSKHQALILYRVNLRVSQAFYPILNFFEVFLRNALDDQLSMHFDDPSWIKNQKNYFMSHSSLSGTSFFLRKEIERVEKKVRNRSRAISASKIVAEQNLGFWTSFFDSHHYSLIGGSVINAFKHKPKSINRKIIALRLKDIRRFRNRVYHNEPICFKGNHIDFTQVILIRDYIIEMMQWIDPELPKVMNYYDNILKKIPPESEKK